MKITTFLLFIAFMQVSAAGLAQKLTLVKNDVTLKQLFLEINKQTTYNVIWSADDVNGDIKINADFKNTPLLEVLDKSLENTHLTYSISNKTVLIKQKERSLLDRVKTALAIPVVVSGKVQDETGQPMVGVTISIKGTNNATTTDGKGAFSFSVPSDKTILLFSYIGYEPLELRAQDITANSVIILKATLTNLHEVVINKGYYTERQEFSVGDVTTINAKTIAQNPVGNVLAAIEGRVPGLVITQNTGAPGGGFAVQIRGQNSILNGNDPFYVIDGVPYSSQMVGFTSATNSYGGTGGGLNSNLNGGNPLNFINPLDIESIDVLKDGDATSIYGSRAANGAILITTKKGKAGPVRVDFNLYSGIGNTARTINLLSTPQYLQVRHEAFKNDGVTPTVGNAPDLMLWDTTRFTNWQKVLTGNTAHYSDAQGNVSGGNENTQYLVGFGYHRETSVYPSALVGEGADQTGSLHFNINTTSQNKKFQLVLTGSYAADQNTVQPNNFVGLALGLPPDAPTLYNANGTLNWAPTSPGLRGTWANPYAVLYRTYSAKNLNTVGNALISYTFLPGLELRSNFGYTNTQTDEVSITPTTSFDPGLLVPSGHSSFLTTNTHSWIVEPQLNYTLKIGKGVFNSLLGGTFNQNNTNGLTQTAIGFTNDALLNDIQAASSVNINQAIYTQYKYEAIFGRLNYTWDEKYVLNLTARRDGSSRFGPGKQFANFGAAGVAWIFTKEDWIQNNLSFLSFGKLRASYGTSGNDQITDYQFLDLYSRTSGYNPYQGTQGLYPINLFNPDLAWETSKKLEGGLELGFFKDRIMLTASYYRNRISNQLVGEPLSSVTGFTFITANLPAVVQNSGWEVMFNTVNVKSKSFNWSSSFNMSIPKNKLLSYPGLSTSPYAQQFVIGEPLTITHVFHSLGVDPTTGVYKFASKTDPFNPVYPDDATQLVNTAPKWYGGFTNNIRYKSVRLDFLFQFVKQTGKNLFAYSPMPGTQANASGLILNEWRKPGDQKPIEQYSQSYSSNAFSALYYYASNSDFVYSDASYVRLKNLSLSYNLPVSWVQKMHMQNCRVYLQGQNLLTFTKYNGYDPESQGENLPPLKVWTLGLQIGL